MKATRPPARFAARLATPIHHLDVSKRFETYAFQQRIRTVGDLVRRFPSKLGSVRAIGARDAAATRRIVERFLGCTWAEALERRKRMTGVEERRARADLRLETLARVLSCLLRSSKSRRRIEVAAVAPRGSSGV